LLDFLQTEGVWVPGGGLKGCYLTEVQLGRGLRVLGNEGHVH
jgi:hypothetical protein